MAFKDEFLKLVQCIMYAKTSVAKLICCRLCSGLKSVFWERNLVPYFRIPLAEV